MERLRQGIGDASMSIMGDVSASAGDTFAMRWQRIARQE